MPTTMIANAAMAAAWDGEEGTAWARDWVRYDRAVAGYEVILQRAADVRPGEHVLDVGCGVGETARAAGRAVGGHGSVLGVDLSSRMIERARDLARAEGLAQMEHARADAQVHCFDEARFDVVVSRFGAMFFADQPAAFANIARAARPGGRLLVVGWRAPADNEWLRCVLGALAVDRRLPAAPPGRPGPFGLADPEQNEAALARAGFDAVTHLPVEAPFWLGHDADDAFEFFRRSGLVRGMTEDLDDVSSARAMDRLLRTMVDHDTGHGVLFDSAAWLVTARRGTPVA